MRNRSFTEASPGPGFTRRQLLRGVGLVGLGALVAPSLTGCAPGREADGVIQFATSNDGVTAEYMKAAAAAFEEQNPGVRIEFSFTPQGAIDAWLVARTAAGQAPDIVELGVSAVSRYSRNGTAVDIAPYVGAGMASALRPVVAALVARDGAIYGVPKETLCSTTYFHRDIVEQIGARVPESAEDGWTWDEFREMCVEAQKITGAYGTSYGYINANSGNRWLPALYQRGGSLFDADNKPSMTSPEALEALEWTRSFYADGLISSTNTIKASQTDTASTLFTTKQVGFMVHESQGSVLQKSLDEDEWGMTYLFTDRQPATNLSGSVNVVTSSSPQPEIAARFLEFYSQSDLAVDACRDRGSISPLKSVSAATVGYEYRPDDVVTIEDQLSSVPEAVGVDMATRDYQTVREVLGDSLDLMFIGSQSAQETAEMINRGLANA
ncbi:MAG: ABC transporter substrate-binding protein [Pseudoclavibacter sp.]